MDVPLVLVVPLGVVFGGHGEAPTVVVPAVPVALAVPACVPAAFPVRAALELPVFIPPVVPTPLGFAAVPTPVPVVVDGTHGVAAGAPVPPTDT